MTAVMGWRVVVTLVVTSLVCVESTDTSIVYCRDMHPQKTLDLDELMGIWNAVEIVQHRDEQRFSGVQTTDTCPVVHLKQTDESGLKLSWQEPAGQVEYLFRITDLTNPGFWLSWGPQNGTMLTKQYQQFAGTVQVMKAVQSHIVLTFCSPNQSLYSVILSRRNYLPSSDIRGIHNLLDRRGLPHYGVRETCKDSASLAAPVAFLFLLSYIVTFLSGKIY